MKLYYWIDHTGPHDMSTGVQRVVRNLAAALVEDGHELIAVQWCPEREAIIHAEQPWITGLARFGGPELVTRPEAGTPIHLSPVDDRLEGGWLLLPEVPHVAGDDAPKVAVALDYARFHWLRSAAVFYDLIPLRQPGYEEMKRSHAEYARALMAADLVLPISAFSARDIQSWWTEQGYDVSRLPQVRAVHSPRNAAGSRASRIRPISPTTQSASSRWELSSHARTRWTSCVPSPACAPDVQISSSGSTSSARFTTASRRPSKRSRQWKSVFGCTATFRRPMRRRL